MTHSEEPDTDHHDAAKLQRIGMPPMIDGMQLIEDYFDEKAEREMVDIIDQQLWSEELARRVQQYGYRYDYRARKVTAELYLGPLPLWLREQAKQLCLTGYMQKVPDQVIVNEYKPGQGITPHVDCEPCFDDTVASLSLNSSCAMEFTPVDSNSRSFSLFLPVRSLLVLSGPARYEWKHAIHKRMRDKVSGRSVPRQRRISVTFRSVLISP